jgi:hypothetical protein
MEGGGHGLRYYPDICMEEMRKTMKTLSQGNLSPAEIEPDTCRIRSRSVSHWTTTFRRGVESEPLFEISSSHGGEYDVQSCLLGCTAV